MHSLEQPLNTDGDSKSLEDMLEDDGPSMNELVVHGGLISDVNNLLHTLSPREQGVLRLRYGLDGQGERTLDDIGRFFKVSRRGFRLFLVIAFHLKKKPNNPNHEIEDLNWVRLVGPDA